MPRFGIKSLLILFAIVGLWLSTFSNYPGSQDIQRIALLLVFVTPGLSALFYRGRRQAFWIGFFATTLIFTFNLSSELEPSLNLTDQVWRSFAGPDWEKYQYFVFRRTLRLLMMLCLSAIVGWIAVSIYDRSRPQD